MPVQHSISIPMPELKSLGHENRILKEIPKNATWEAFDLMIDFSPSEEGFGFQTGEAASEFACVLSISTTASGKLVCSKRPTQVSKWYIELLQSNIQSAQARYNLAAGSLNRRLASFGNIIIKAAENCPVTTDDMMRYNSKAVAWVGAMIDFVVSLAAEIEMGNIPFPEAFVNLSRGLKHFARKCRVEQGPNRRAA